MPLRRYPRRWNIGLSARFTSAHVVSGNPPLVCLCGFMGSGKTTVGRALGAKLDWPFVDLDDLIVAAEGRSIAEIFRDEGEPYFRGIESAALQDLLNIAPPSVLALGGGAFIQEINRERLRKARTLTVFLDTDHDMLYERCFTQGGVRPLLQDRERFRELYEQRRPIYRMADLTVDVSGRTPQDIAAEIAQRLAARVAVPD